MLRARGEGEQARVALGELCAAYWFPLYAWARREGLPPADAEDAVQGFFAAVLEQKLFDRADAERGRLRSFLLVAFRRHLRDERVKAGAQRRGGGRVVSFDAVAAEEWFQSEPATSETPEHYFDRHWALTLLERALASVGEAYSRRGKETEFGALRPFLTAGGSSADYEAAGRAVGLGGGAFKVALHRLRERFREALRSEVRETQAGVDGEDGEDGEGGVDEEMGYLLRVLQES